MRQIRISDITIGTAETDKSLTFREKIKTAELLERLGVSVIELGTVSGKMAENMLIKSVASAVHTATVAVCPGFAAESIASVWEALRGNAHPRLQVCAAVSTSRMEYVYHKKASEMAKSAVQAVAECKKLCADVEFIAEDATRAHFDYLCETVSAAIEAGAQTVTVCDTAGTMLPGEFAAFLAKLTEAVPALQKVTLGVRCANTLNVADAVAIAAIGAGAAEIKVTALDTNNASLNTVTKILAAKAEMLGVSCTMQTTELSRVLEELRKFGAKGEQKSPFEDGVREMPQNVRFTVDDTPEAIRKGVADLGYDLTDEDHDRVWKAFRTVAQRKESVSIGELEMLIAAETMQVPATYTLESYVVTTGNAMDIVAHVKLKKGQEVLNGLSLGDGPIDAAFLAIEKIVGHHYELDDFQIQAVTEGHEAMGQTVVKLRSGGKVYAGRGISTDIIGSGVAAYISALNKILYEEAHA